MPHAPSSCLTTRRDNRQVVKELHIMPEQADILRESYLNSGGAARTISEVAWEALEALVGKFDSVVDLVERIKELKARMRDQ
jgi:hypothetical protein